MIRVGILFLLSIVFCTAWGQPTPPGAPAVVITEIMYQSPQIGADDLEFIELKNPSDTSERSLSGHSFTEGIEYQFPFGLLIPPSGYVIIAKDSIAFENTFGLPAYQWTSGSLDDQGELILLRGQFNQVADSVVYSNNILWPQEAAGNGASIVLCTDSFANAGPENWIAANTNTGISVNGTTIFANPGQGCSSENSIVTVAEHKMSIFPNPNSGAFTVELPAEHFESELQSSIFSMDGRRVYSQTWPSDFQVLQVNAQLSSGVYLLQIESKNKRLQQVISVLE